ncbi:hypothetical protein ALC62_00905 [Cyphomyrmex costatus]|uniref:Uncharacterized protein n=1 Tax=Cyphomyrmex costatus TaxID=456900 RepID=A0A195D581_9HYME|nr:hypothetical protein ALC62_00905 [Cyphomyrmex costatus]
MEGRSSECVQCRTRFSFLRDDNIVRRINKVKRIIKEILPERVIRARGSFNFHLYVYVEKVAGKLRKLLLCVINKVVLSRVGITRVQNQDSMVTFRLLRRDVKSRHVAQEPFVTQRSRYGDASAPAVLVGGTTRSNFCVRTLRLESTGRHCCETRGG